MIFIINEYSSRTIKFHIYLKRLHPFLPLQKNKRRIFKVKESNEERTFEYSLAQETK